MSRAMNRALKPMNRPTAEVHRIDWVPGTDVLRGLCHCGAGHHARDPEEMWAWLLAHPDGHAPPRKGGPE